MAGGRIPHLKTLWVKDRSVTGAPPDSGPPTSTGAGSSQAAPPITDHAELSGLQGGTSGQYYHLTAAEKGHIVGAALFLHANVH